MKYFTTWIFSYRADKQLLSNVTLRSTTRLKGCLARSSQSFFQSSSIWIVGAADFPPLEWCKLHTICKIARAHTRNPSKRPGNQGRFANGPGTGSRGRVRLGSHGRTLTVSRSVPEQGVGEPLSMIAASVLGLYRCGLWLLASPTTRVSHKD